MIMDSWGFLRDSSGLPIVYFLGLLLGFIFAPFWNRQGFQLSLRDSNNGRIKGPSTPFTKKVFVAHKKILTSLGNLRISLREHTAYHFFMEGVVGIS